MNEKKLRDSEYKPLSFSTTMRNPDRIADFLKCVLPFEEKKLTNEIINKVVLKLIKHKLYQPVYITRTPRLKKILNSDELFSDSECQEIMEASPQQHKEHGFDRGWPSRFDTWYKLPMEFGFIYYAMNEPIKISKTGHMLIDAQNEETVNGEKIQNVFLNSMMKYQTNNPFRKNANSNVPLLLLLQVINLLKKDDANSPGIFIKELSLFICWPNNDYKALYNYIIDLRNTKSFNYSDEYIYDKCLELLHSTNKKRFKISQITEEAVDEFIRKMRATGVISLRGNGRFLDSNSYAQEKIKYILKNYSNYKTFTNCKDFFEYMGAIDNYIVDTPEYIDENLINNKKLETLNYWVNNYSQDDIFDELRITCNKKESKNPILRFIDKPTRLEFLTSIALKQKYKDLVVIPNYHVDDEGIPTFTASGGMADIECFDKDCNPLVEVTLMQNKSQSTNEVPGITRHLKEAIDKYGSITVFALLIAPTIHEDTKFMTGYAKYQEHVDIIPLSVPDFIEQLDVNEHIIDFLSEEISA